MKKRYILLLSAISTFDLSARENPFLPFNKKDSSTILYPIKKVETKPIQEIEPIKKIEPSPIEIAKPVVNTKKNNKIEINPKKNINKPTKKRYKFSTIYSGKFIKISLHKNSIKIYTKDILLKDIKLKNPNRISLDFERFDVIGPIFKNINSLRVKSLKIGHHDYFYRVTFILKKGYRYKITKKNYGYLISF